MKGPTSSRPPDPTRTTAHKEALEIPSPNSFEQNEISASAKGDGAEGQRSANETMLDAAAEGEVTESAAH